MSFLIQYKYMALEIGLYVVDVETGNVSKDGVPMKWGGKATQLFCLLLENTPKTITKEAIFAQVWKDRVVTENTLYKAISKLRQELNQDGIEIESMFGEGYRITINVSSNQQVKFRLSNHHLIETVLIAGLILWIAINGYRWINQAQLESQMVSLDKHLAVTKQAFISQINRRNELGEMLSQRFELISSRFMGKTVLSTA